MGKVQGDRGVREACKEPISGSWLVGRSQPGAGGGQSLQALSARVAEAPNLDCIAPGPGQRRSPGGTGSSAIPQIMRKALEGQLLTSFCTEEGEKKKRELLQF